MHRRVIPRALLIAALVAVVVLSGGPSPSDAEAQAAACVTFPETGKTVCDPFLSYWQAHGGLAQQGLPLTDAFREVNPTDGKVYKTQYFERARFELHPENTAPYDVLLGLLGREQLVARYGGTPPAGVADNPLGGSCASFEQTGKQVCGAFLQYWQQNDGLAQQGLPLTDLFIETNPTDGKPYPTQYFERARFEYHAENLNTPYVVLLGLLGREQLLAKYPNGVPVGPMPLGTAPVGWKTYGGTARVPFAMYYPPNWTVDDSRAGEGRVYFYGPGVAQPLANQLWVLIATTGVRDPDATIEALRDRYFQEQIKDGHPEAAIDITRNNKLSGITFASLGATFNEGKDLCYAYIGLGLKDQVPWRFRLNSIYADYDQNLEDYFGGMINSLNIYANP